MSNSDSNGLLSELRVLHVVSTLHTGGAEIQVASYVRALREMGVHAGICVIRETGDLYHELKAEGVPTWHIKFRSRWHPLSLWELRSLLAGERFNLIQGHMYRSNVPSTVAGRLAGCEGVITTVHAFWDNDRQSAMDRRLNRFRDRVLVVSQEKQEYYLARAPMPKEHCLIFPSAIDIARIDSGDPEALRRELGMDAETPLVGMIARAAEPKDYATFIEAAAKFHAKRPEVRFVAVGDGDLLPELRKHAARHEGLPLDFLGKRQDIPDILAALDVFVLSTKMEGTPLSILEAMASRTPVVATPVGGIPEVVTEGETGWLFPVGNAEALAERLFALIDSPQVAVTDRARTLVEERYGIQARTRELVAIYQEILRERRRAHRP